MPDSINIRIPAIGPLKRFGKPSVEDQVESKVKEELNKVRASDIVRFKPTQISSIGKGGSQRKLFPLGISFSILRDFADFYPIARACIEYRKSQITQLDWKITPTLMTILLLRNGHGLFIL